MIYCPKKVLKICTWRRPIHWTQQFCLLGGQRRQYLHWSGSLSNQVWWLWAHAQGALERGFSTTRRRDCQFQSYLDLGFSFFTKVSPLHELPAGKLSFETSAPTKRTLSSLLAYTDPRFAENCACSNQKLYKIPLMQIFATIGKMKPSA